MKLARFLPQDTRLSELAAGWALVILGVVTGLHSFGVVDKVTLTALTQFQPNSFWSVVLVCMGFLQIYAVAAYPLVDVLRAVLSWFSGSIWIWVALSSNGGFMNPPDPAAFTLGIANLYAFVVNTLLLRSKWMN